MPEILAPERNSDFPWRTVTARLTAFPVAGESFPSAWWEQVIESPPSSRFLQSQGMFQAGQLVLQATAARVDWIWSALATTAEPSLGALPEISATFHGRMAKWLGCMA